MEECRKQIFMLDSKGLVCESRLHELQHHKLKFAHDVGETRACSRNRSTHAFRDCSVTQSAVVAGNAVWRIFRTTQREVQELAHV